MPRPLQPIMATTIFSPGVLVAAHVVPPPKVAKAAVSIEPCFRNWRRVDLFIRHKIPTLNFHSGLGHCLPVQHFQLYAATAIVFVYFGRKGEVKFSDWQRFVASSPPNRFMSAGSISDPHFH